MKLSSLYEDLSYGELSNLSMSVEGSGSIQEEKQPTIVRYANDALVVLYTRFILKQKDVLIEQVEHITNYHLLSRFAEHGSDNENHSYIKDLSGEPFTEDVAKILEVYNDLGIAVPLNDSERYDSLFTPQSNVLQIPTPQHGQALSVLYQAFHPKLPVDDPDAEIELPLVLHNAFRSYIAYKVYSAMGTQEAKATAQEHLGNYEAQCQLAIDKDLVNTSVGTTNARFEKRGFR